MPGRSAPFYPLVQKTIFLRSKTRLKKMMEKVEEEEEEENEVKEKKPSNNIFSFKMEISLERFTLQLRPTSYSLHALHHYLSENHPERNHKKKKKY